MRKFGFLSLTFGFFFLADASPNNGVAGRFGPGAVLQSSLWMRKLGEDEFSDFLAHCIRHFSGVPEVDAVADTGFGDLSDEVVDRRPAAGRSGQCRTN